MGIRTCRSMIPTSITGITGTGSAATTEESIMLHHNCHIVFFCFFLGKFAATTNTNTLLPLQVLL